MTKRLPALVLALVAAHTLRAAALDDIVNDSGLWKLDRDALATKLAPLRFVWTSGAKDTLRADKGGTIAGLAAGETLVRVDPKSGNPTRIEISLYNRGDQGDKAEKEFKALLAKAGDAINAVSGAKPEFIPHDLSSVVRAAATVWDGQKATYKLGWINPRESGRAEFLHLLVFPAGKAPELLKAAHDSQSTKAAKKFVAKEHIGTTDEGDVWLKDVPMVDQGQKGYCAVASTERVMRFYGLAVDEHDIAKLADASGDGGTNPEKLIAAFEKQSGRLHVRVNPLMTTDAKYFSGLVSDYNRAARKNKVAPLPNPGSREFYSTFSFDRLDGPTLVAGRKANASGIKNLERLVAGAIDKGIPVMWCVSLGYVEENPKLPQAKGGHMRLLIGYNAKKHTLIYTDSWGAGHERKAMDAGDAFAITNGLITLIPR